MSAPARITDSAAFTHTLRATHDADEHAACLTNWQQRYDQLSAGSFASEFEEFCFGNVQFFREDLNQIVHQRGSAWPGSRTFALPITVDGTGWFGGEVCTEHSLLTLGADDELDFRTPRRISLLALTMDAAVLSSYAMQVDHRDLDGELAGRRRAPTDPKRIAAFGRLLTTMKASLQATPDLLRHPQMQKALEQGLFASLLDTLSPLTATLGPPPCHTRQLVVARAREFMEAHIDEPITVADLCVQLGVSRRTLQYSFQDVLALNPVKFLRAIRLNAVRRALKAAEPGGRDTVADLAARWGFWHLSHFSAEYKAMFGELPSETLRRPG